MQRIILLALWCVMTLARPVQAQPVTVFAAASLRDALTEIAANFDPGITLSFGGSGTIARQIASGAPADVVVLAHRDWATWLASRGLLQDGTMIEIAGGQLVLIGAAGTPPVAQPDQKSLLMMLQGGRLAMGQRDGVPAGIYAREWLSSIGAWERMIPHLAETDNVRAALALVALGAAPLGIVYASDVVAETRVNIVYAIPSSAHTPIRYPAAAITEAGKPFLAYLSTPQATAIFARYGFTP